MAVVTTQDISSDNAVPIDKHTRELGVLPEGTEEAKLLAEDSKAKYDNSLRRYVLGYRPWIFSSFQEWVMGISRKGARGSCLFVGRCNANSGIRHDEHPVDALASFM